MNKNVAKLYEIAQKPIRTIIGLMSGTSLDGLDVALCEYQNQGLETQVNVKRFITVPYEEDFKNQIREIFAKSTISFEKLCLLNAQIGLKHAEIINDCLKNWSIEAKAVDCIASHGQTVYHAPKILHQKEGFPNATLQIGDADHIAVKTGIITLSDFRQKHCAAGGEGAPLAVYGDYLIFSKKGRSRILLNMGGISNYTYLDGNLDPNLIFATDTGPGNTIIDAYVQKYFGVPYDKDAKLALSGKINQSLLTTLKDNVFFRSAIPKTTGPELFNLDYLDQAKQKSGTKALSHVDTLATLCRFTAETIAECIAIDQTADIFLSGGGMHNPLIISNLKQLLPGFEFFSTNEIGIDGDAKEAVLFATLANETLAGGKTNFGKHVSNVSLGKISFPS